MRVVLDTRVIVAASRSRSGASFELIRRLDDRCYEPALSVALYAEWRDALSRPENRPAGVAVEEAFGFLRYLASRSILQPIYFLWWPFLSDPDDDMVLELAVAARCGQIVTHNRSDFTGSERFGVEAVSPAAFLEIVRQST